ncbi:hypothetical protein F4808DRAFT_220650 [Astrocystis sublimbata]|nr:hypothetical protein F4808DRAFT_220650 [Astrocystis sublimbata]
MVSQAMATGEPSKPAAVTSSIGPSAVGRSTSSQSAPQEHQQQQQLSEASSNATPSPSPSGGVRPRVSVRRRQSREERINSILEAGRHRADSMNAQGLRSLKRVSTMPTMTGHLSPGNIDEPDESTSLASASQPINYQTTQTTPKLRNRQTSQITADADPISRNESNIPQGEAETTQHWLWSFFDGVWSFELENKGSVARDHLALERTFLAWLRTSLAFASIGIAITQLFRLNSSLANEQTEHRFRQLGRPLGATFIGISILVLLLGYQRFYQPQQWLLKGKFPASRGSIILVTFVAFSLMLISLIVVLVVQPPEPTD